MQALAALRRGKSQAEKHRLDAAACYLVHCASGVPPSDSKYHELQALQKAGKADTKEVALLKQTGLFNYSLGDTVYDFRTKNDRDVTRLEGAANVLSGEFVAVGSVGVGLLTCPETGGIGCAAGAFGGAVGLSQANAGVQQISGAYTSQYGQAVLNSFNPKTWQSGPSTLGRDVLELGPAALGLGGDAVLAKAGAAATGRLGAWLDLLNSGVPKGTVWDLKATTRGKVIESELAKSDYKAWYNVGSSQNGYFPLVDFQNGNTLVSLKSVDTTGKVIPPFLAVFRSGGVKPPGLASVSG